MARKATTDSAMILLIGAIVTIAVVGFALSSCQEDIGIAQPSNGTVAMVGRVAEAHTVLEARESYAQYSEAFRVAAHAYDGLVLHNAADSEVRSALSSGMDCMRVAREAWQAETDDAWDSETYGSAEYWRGRYPSAELDLPSGELSPEDVITAATACAGEGLAETTAMVGE